MPRVIETEMLLTVKEFAAALNISEKQARYYARSEPFQRYKVAIDIAVNAAKPVRKHGTGRRNHNWRIYWNKYEDAVKKGLLSL